jgi:cytochrome P450
MTTTLAPDDTLARLDLGDLELWRDGPPHARFADLRAMPGLHWSSLSGFPEERGFWSVVRFEDVAVVGRDHARFSSEEGGIIAVDKLWDLPGMPSSLELTRKMLIAQDPPRHDRLKALVQAAFTPKRALAHSARIREIVNLVYDRALKAHPDGLVDLVQDVGIYVPAMAIGDMLGVPREDADKMVNWTNRTTGFEDPRVAPTSEDTFEALAEVFAYVSAMVEQRREHPTDDLTTALIGAEVDGEHLEHEEILMFWFLLMVAGNDSTRATFTSGLLSLLHDPGQMALVRERPDLHESAVEEFVRYHPAFAYMRRTATCDTEVAGQAIAKGDKLLLWYVSSNRDGAAFEQADTFDVRRSPNKHQGFGGGGRHFCLGAGLARLEMKLWLEETLRRFPRLALAGEPTRLSSTFLNQYRTIPVALEGDRARRVRP